MTEIEGQVRRLLFEEGVSSTEAAERLCLSPAEVVSIAVQSRSHPNGSAPKQPKPVEPVNDAGQIHLLRSQVRAGLLARTRGDAVEDFPASALVRLWQLIEDPKLLSAGDPEEGDLFDVPEATREEIFRLLDER
jgi:hypothetical protein